MKTPETENGKDRDKRNHTKAKTEKNEEACTIFQTNHFISSLQPWEVGSVYYHFTDVETEGNCSVSQSIAQEPPYLSWEVAGEGPG